MTGISGLPGRWPLLSDRYKQNTSVTLWNQALNQAKQVPEQSSRPPTRRRERSRWNSSTAAIRRTRASTARSPTRRSSGDTLTGDRAAAGLRQGPGPRRGAAPRLRPQAGQCRAVCGAAGQVQPRAGRRSGRPARDPCHHRAQRRAGGAAADHLDDRGRREIGRGPAPGQAERAAGPDRRGSRPDRRDDGPEGFRRDAQGACKLSARRPAADEGARGADRVPDRRFRPAHGRAVLRPARKCSPGPEDRRLERVPDRRGGGVAAPDQSAPAGPDSGFRRAIRRRPTSSPSCPSTARWTPRRSRSMPAI